MCVPTPWGRVQGLGCRAQASALAYFERTGESVFDAYAAAELAAEQAGGAPWPEPAQGCRGRARSSRPGRGGARLSKSFLLIRVTVDPWAEPQRAGEHRVVERCGRFAAVVRRHATTSTFHPHVLAMNLATGQRVGWDVSGFQRSFLVDRHP
jgi:hypothetical protein